MATPQNRIRRRLPPFIVPWNGEEDIDTGFTEPEPAVPLARPRIPLPEMLAPVAESAPLIERPRITPIEELNEQAPVLAPTAIGKRPRQLQGLLPSDRLASQIQYRGAVEDYEPRTESRKATAGRMLLGFLNHGILGTVPPLLDRKATDRNWRARELEGIEGQEVQGLQSRLLRARVADAEREPVAPIARVAPPRFGKEVLPDGTEIATIWDEQGQTFRPLRRGEQNIVTGRPKPENLRPRIKVPVPGVGEIEVTPEAALGYYGTRSRNEEQAGAAEQANAQIQASIADAQRERDGIGAALKTTPPTIEETNVYGDKKSVPNPEYRDLMDRYRQLDDQIRTRRTQLKPRAGSRPLVIPKNAKGRKWSRSAFAARYPDVDVAAAEREMKNAGAVVID